MLLEKDLNLEMGDLNKYANYYTLLDFWMKNMEEGKNISEFFQSRSYKKIGIYGIAGVGCHLIDQLLKSDIKVLYTIDKMIVNIGGKRLEECYENLPNIDVMVITPVYDYPIIKEDIKSYINADIISLEEVILSI